MKRNQNSKHVTPDHLGGENEKSETIRSKEKIANKFNKHFATVGTNLSTRLPPSKNSINPI